MAINVWPVYRQYIVDLMKVMHNYTSRPFQETKDGTDLTSQPTSVMDGAFSIEFGGIENVDMSLGQSSIRFDTVVRLNVGFLLNVAEQTSGITGELVNDKAQYNAASNDIHIIIYKILTGDSQSLFEELAFRQATELARSDGNKNFYTTSIDFLIGRRVNT